MWEIFGDADGIVLFNWHYSYMYYTLTGGLFEWHYVERIKSDLSSMSIL